MSWKKAMLKDLCHAYIRCDLKHVAGPPNRQNYQLGVWTWAIQVPRLPPHSIAHHFKIHLHAASIKNNFQSNKNLKRREEQQKKHYKKAHTHTRTQNSAENKNRRQIADRGLSETTDPYMLMLLKRICFIIFGQKTKNITMRSAGCCCLLLMPLVRTHERR